MKCHISCPNTADEKVKLNFAKCLHLAWSYTTKFIEIHRKDFKDSIAGFISLDGVSNVSFNFYNSH